MTMIPDHLGGFGTGPHGDEATWYPDMWTWLVNQRGVKSVLDIGCGQGHAGRFFHDLGCKVLAVDGVPIEPTQPFRFDCHDFTVGPYEVPWIGVDKINLGWFCEVAEHVEEEFLPNVAPAIQACDTVLMTHAFPGQGGHHHVNLREPAYWANWFGLLGYRLDEDITRACRAIAALNPSPYNHWVRSGMAFVRHQE